MTAFEKKRFSVAVGSDAFREGYERIFRGEKSELPDCDRCGKENSGSIVVGALLWCAACEKEVFPS